MSRYLARVAFSLCLVLFLSLSFFLLLFLCFFFCCCCYFCFEEEKGKGLLNLLAPVVQRVDSTIQRIA